MNKALGIVNFSGNHIWVEGLQPYPPIGAFSFLGRYRVIDFPISNMSNSGIDQIQVYIRRKPRSLAEHLGTGRHYNINSKRGRLHILFAETGVEHDIYNNDIAAFRENLECIRSATCPYVVIAPSYMIYAQDFNELLQTHIDSGADITLLYHSTDDAKEHFLNCNTVNLNKQKGVLSLEMNRGTAKNRQIFMDTYVMSRSSSWTSSTRLTRPPPCTPWRTSSAPPARNWMCAACPTADTSPPSRISRATMTRTSR